MGNCMGRDPTQKDNLGALSSIKIRAKGITLQPDDDINLKLVIVGDAGVGKSALILRFADNTFTESYICTIGVDFKRRRLEVDDKVLNLIMWDTAGQERFRTITKSFYRAGHGFVVVYDITNRESFLHVTGWVQDVERFRSYQAPILLIGNKSDLPNRQVTIEEARCFAEERGILWMETSAKIADNVNEAIHELSRVLVQNMSFALNGVDVR